jgi:hypothetical protein
MSVEEYVLSRPRLIKKETKEGYTYFTGPLGLWIFPLVNLILAIVESIRVRTYQVPQPKRRMTVFDITRDREGRIISIIEREVED